MKRSERERILLSPFSDEALGFLNGLALLVLSLGFPLYTLILS